MEKRIGIIGGDRRQAELAGILRREGKDVATCGLSRWLPGQESLEQAAEREILILPLPLCRNEGGFNWEEGFLDTRDLFALLRPEQILFAGNVQPRQYKEAADRGLMLLDYLRREEFAVWNAAATAEAAIQVAMEHSERSLCGKNCLILGFGRIGKMLAPRLKGLGVTVTVAARKTEDRAWICGYGFRHLPLTDLKGNLGGFDLVYNTVPAMILDEALCRELPEHCLAIELASRAGIAAEGRAVAALGLPGKYVPVAAAQAIREALRDTIL